MSNLNRHPVRRTAAGVLAGALAFSGAFAAGTPAHAATGFSLDRIAGVDRYDTSARTAAAFDAAANVTNVILASGETGRAADALGASFLAGVRSAPVLLTAQATLPATTRAALTSLRANGATTVTIVGGTTAVSANVMSQVMALGFTVDRLAGQDRFGTAEAVVAAGEGTSASNVGIVASGLSTVDALAVGPLAYKGKHPIFLTRAEGISASTLAAMRTAGVTSVYIVGGEAVVSAAVRAQLTAAGITVVDRLAGQTRSGTSVAIANAIIGGTFGFSNMTFNVASGANDGVDALSGAALSGLQNRALLITDTATNAGAVTAFATARAATLNTAGIIFGGPAAVSPAVEAAIEAAGAANVGPVGLTATTVAQGGNLTGTITGDFSSVTFTGCGFTTAQTVGADTDTAAAGRQFSIAVPSNQAVGECDITFTFTPTGGGAATTQVVRVNVTQAVVVSATVRPELQSAVITGTVVAGTETTANPVGTSVRYTFDEVVTAPQLANFAVYTAAGVRTAATAVTLETGGRSVLARFAGFNSTALAADLTTATVDMNAVIDLEGNGSPEGDAAIGTAVAAGGAGALPAGITDGPDLLSVGNFRAAAADTQTAVDFTFDEAATLAGATATLANFNLVLQNGTVLPAQTGLGFTNTGGGTVPGGNTTTTFTLVFTNPGGNTDIAAGDVNRGYVLAGTVRDTATTPNQNVTQAADVAGGTPTLEPDLVSVAFRPSADTTADQVLFTFDQAVSAANFANFRLYQADGDVVSGATAAVINTANTAQVLVSFADQALVDVVGAQALAGAVTSASLSQPNEIDEEGAAGTSAASSGRTPGATAGPDLTSVALATTTDPFGNAGNFQATYTFDADIAGTAGGALAGGAASVAKFKLYLANGTMLTANGATIGSTEATDNTVVVTFAGAAGAAPTSATVGSATLGTVDDGAVQGTGTATTISGTGTGATNPEGAALTTGGTGTRAQ